LEMCLPLLVAIAVLQYHFLCASKKY